MDVLDKVKIKKGDITKFKTEAIVNAANKRLAPGGGVAGAIHRVGGSKLTKECKKLGGCKTGEAKITKAYNLPASYVIHTVGPIYGKENGKEERLLRSCYKESLKIAQENNIKTIAFPALSTGAFGYPKKEAVEIAIKAIKDYLESNDSDLEEIILVGFTREDANLYKSILEELKN